MDEQIYYHFVSRNKRLRYDLRETEVYVGLTLAAADADAAQADKLEAMVAEALQSQGQVEQS